MVWLYVKVDTNHCNCHTPSKTGAVVFKVLRAMHTKLSVINFEKNSQLD